MLGEIRQREYSVRELLVQGLRVFGSQILVIAAVALGTDAFANEISEVVWYSMTPHLSEPLYRWIASGAIFVFFACMEILATLVVTQVAEAATMGHDWSFRGVVSKSVCLWPRAIGSFLLCVLISLGLVLVVEAFSMVIPLIRMLAPIPMIIAIVYLFLVVFAVAIERLGSIGALRRSRTLVSGRWWKMAGILIATGAPVALVQRAATTLWIHLGAAPWLSHALWAVVGVVGRYPIVVCTIFYLNRSFTDDFEILEDVTLRWKTTHTPPAE